MNNHKKIIIPEFFNRPILEICPELLGKKLIRKIGSSIYSLILTEIEAYDGPNDMASHGKFGKTKRNAVMFAPAGHFYVYLIYGIHWMLNIVTGPQNYPAAILIRGTNEISGPGKLTKHLNINKSLNNKPILPKSGLWIEEGDAPPKYNNIITTPRIGIDFAGPVWSKKPYRFILKI